MLSVLLLRAQGVADLDQKFFLRRTFGRFRFRRGLFLFLHVVDGLHQLLQRYYSARRVKVVAQALPDLLLRALQPSVEDQLRLFLSRRVLVCKETREEGVGTC